MLLTKGFEVEMYTGTPEGDIVGLSDKIVAALNRFVREPDSRNVEYTTAPLCGYDRLLCELVQPRLLVRNYLKTLGDYTLLPGSCLSMGDTKVFYRSDPTNHYHSYIEETYGTNVVTASVHINIGIPNPELLMRAYRLVRVEAPLFLALSASSPFLDGEVTGYHSTRWQMFPKTPKHVPLFASHKHFIEWTEAQLALGTMKNVRHLWSSVRPNGDRRPYDINRLELRICDLISSPISLLAMTAFLEARLWQLLENPDLDPLISSELPGSDREETMLALTDANETAAARDSLDAKLRHWQDGRTIIARDWIEEIYQELSPIAKKLGFHCFLSPLKKILREGNEAQQWLKLHTEGMDTRSIIRQRMQLMLEMEKELEDKLCQPLVA
ncbi:MAG TPA: glutamate--cysteine ligase [Oscillatoriaceae cyanobacterium M33_DOE_052]|uniref:Glutamate--cysteine ligase n=1 Tax=Planktothricoides sp. SpSt-374 TaxID=2282167 RepID=A0A7C3VUM4_9CYAN|nr:glutamate--cysteine ligase [Oscillatoriaceae cyanobacterium M33_DOE_052]